MNKTLLKLTAALALISSPALAHQALEIGPNGGRLLAFSANHSTYGEVTMKDGKLHVALLDKNKKAVELEKQTLSATTGDRNNPEKLDVEKKDGKFIVPLQKGEDHWTIFQFRESANAKPVTARLHYDTKPCPECKKPEWICECGTKEHTKKK